MISTLKEAVHQVLESAPMPTRQLAEEIGVSYSYLMNAANPELSDFKLAARVLIPLTRITGDFAAIDFIERSLGRTALTLPGKKANLKDIHAEMYDTVSSFGELIHTATDALADNKITAAEARELEQSGYNLIHEVLEFLQAIEDCRRTRRGDVS